MSNALNQTQRAELIDQLDRSFQVMPRWVKASVKHALGAPKNHPETGKPFTSFREVIEASSDETLLILKSDFQDNGELLEAGKPNQSKPVIVYGPQACGKTRNSQRIARHFGLSIIVDDWLPKTGPLSTNTLYLTNESLAWNIEIQKAVASGEVSIFSFEQLTQQIVGLVVAA